MDTHPQSAADPHHGHEQVIVIGGGQAGLSAGHHLARRGMTPVILDASTRIGDAWRNRWDSLRLFTPAQYNSLDGLAFPGQKHTFPTKDEMADYLESYARHFELDVRSGVAVQRLSRDGEHFLVKTTDGTWTADNVVVAMGNHSVPKVPTFATELDPRIVQFHSSAYRNPDQVQSGDVLLVGAGNSGSELAVELARTHKVFMAGRDVGHIPFRVEKWFGRTFGAPVVLRFLFRKVLTINTPVGRKARPKVLSVGGPLIRVKPKDLKAKGVVRVGRVDEVRHGKPVLEDGTVLDVANVIWCTGYVNPFSWIDLPIHGEHEPLQVGGVVGDQPGLFFVGLEFQTSLSSEMVQGVGHDADLIAGKVATRVSTRSDGADAATGSAARHGRGRRERVA